MIPKRALSRSRSSQGGGLAAERDRRSLSLIVRDEIRSLLQEEHAQIGDQLPSEAVLVDRFHVARTTIREALKLLEQDGLIDVQHGRGRFVTAVPGTIRPITRLESVTEMMVDLGYDLSSVVLGHETRQAFPIEAEALRLAPGAQVLCLERLRLHQSQVLIYSADVMPHDILVELPERTDWTGSLFMYLTGAGQKIVFASAEIRAARLPSGVCARAGLDPLAPWLLLLQTNFNQSGRPVIYSTDYHRADVIGFQVLRRRAG